MPQQLTERSYIAPRDVRAVLMTAEDVADYQALHDLGITFTPKQVARMAQFAQDAYEAAMDDAQGLLTTASIPTPVQFLQNWLPGFVNIITGARKIDQLTGISTIGSWEDEEVVQGLLEPVGDAVPYGDYTNVPLATWNLNFEKRTVVRFEKGIKVGVLEEARASRIRVSSAAQKRNASGLALEVERNKIGFYGYNSGANLTYGFLNDPGLPNYVTVANGASASPLWSTKTFLEITADIRSWAAALQTTSQDTINPEEVNTTLALATTVYQYLSVTSDFGISVRQWIRETYPKMSIESAPQLNAANGGANVAYLYPETVNDGSSDDNRVFIQVVPARFQALGVEKQSKAYVEDYVNATAGVWCKRPYAVHRASGI